MKGKPGKVEPREHAPWQSQEIGIASDNPEYAVETFGEVFVDGSAVDLVVDDREHVLRLVFWDGREAEIVAHMTGGFSPRPQPKAML